MDQAVAACPKIKIFYYWWWRNYIRHPFADKIELTLVHHTFEADAFFPVIKEEEWVYNNQNYN
jgi:dihydrofolate reductase